MASLDQFERYESRYVKTGKFDTHFIEAGNGEPLVLVHGGGPGADGWGNWFSCLSQFKKYFRTFAIDLAGYGRSEPPAGYGYSQLARNEQLIALVEMLQVGQVSMVGNSMGGATALGVAMQRPDLVKSLVLMGSAGLNYNVGKVGEAVKPLAGYDYTLKGMERIAGALGGPNFKPVEGMLEYRFELATRAERKNSFDKINAWIIGQKGLHYEESDVAKVKTRTLIVNGKLDKVATLEQAYLFLSLLQNSYGFIIPDCGHWAMLEHPKLFSEQAISFLQGY